MQNSCQGKLITCVACIKNNNFAIKMKSNHSKHRCESRKSFSDMLLHAKGDKSKIDEAIQAEARRKTHFKLPGFLVCPDFRFPTLLSAEQCSSEITANFHASLIEPGNTIVDLTAGLGIDSFTFSRKASSVISIEHSEEIYNSLLHNASVLGLSNVKPLNHDCIEWLRSPESTFVDVIYADPYRRDDAGGRVFSLRGSLPDVVENLSIILSKCNRMIVKASPMFDISAAAAELGDSLQEVIIVGTHTECKELLLICANTPHQYVQLRSVTLDNFGEVISEFRWSSTDSPSPLAVYKSPEQGMILYEPFPAIMKGGQFNKLSSDFSVSKIAPLTHLYLSFVPVGDFPGTKYRILEVHQFNKQSVRKIKQFHEYINVATRNFPIKAPLLEAQLATKSGGNLKLFGLTDSDGKKLMIVGKPL